MEPGLCDVLFIVVTRRAHLRRSSLFIYIYILNFLLLLWIFCLFVVGQEILTDGVEIWGKFFFEPDCGLWA